MLELKSSFREMVLGLVIFSLITLINATATRSEECPGVGNSTTTGNYQFSGCMHQEAATSPLSIVGPDSAPGNPDQGLPQGTYEYVAIGGIPPYIWQVEGPGVSLTTTPEGTAMVTVGPAACGTFAVTVTEACNQREEKLVRSFAGKWTHLERQDISGNCRYWAYSCGASPWGHEWVEGGNRYVDCYGATAITVCASAGQTFESVLPNCSPPPKGPKVISEFTDCYICSGCQKKTYCFLQCVDVYQWGC